MHIEKIKRMYPGQMVRCPENHGSPAHTGVIRSIGDAVQETPNGTQYVWVTVRALNHDAVWPSNRLQ